MKTYYAIENLVVDGNLELSNTKIQTLPEGLEVKGWLNLRNTPIRSLPEGLKVGGGLNLSNTPIQALPENLTVGEWIILNNTSIQALPENLTVGGGLDLSNTLIQALPENLTVGGGLDLSDTPIQALPENLTVGGGLYLSSTPIQVIPESLKVGDYIYLSNTKLSDSQEELNHKVQKLQNGEYKENSYIYCDGCLTLIRKTKKLDKYTVYIGKIPGQNVVSNGKHFAHCDKIRDGIADLIYKEASDRGAEQYRGYRLDEPHTVKELMTMYRVITGACRQGTEEFVKSIRHTKDTYTIAEVIQLTKGQFGSDAFEAFFS